MMKLHWLFTSSKRRARCARRRQGNDRLLAHARPRTLRLEAAEPRLLLSHTAPQLNPSDAAFFASLNENAAIGSNYGENVSDMLATGGPIVYNQPLGNNFLTIDNHDGGVEGIAITGVTGAGDGVWEYSTGSGWSILDPGTTAANAERLGSNDRVRFLPNEGFLGTVRISFAAWDVTDGGQEGTSVDLTAPEATGGGTAYSTAMATATLDVLPSLPTIAPPALADSIASATVAQAGDLNKQYVFTVGADGLVREDQYVYSPSGDTGLSVIDPNTVFPVGAKLTAYSDGNSVNVFGVDQAGQAVWNQFTAASGWSGFVPLGSFMAGASATFAPGSGLAAVARTSEFDLFDADINGDLEEFTYATATKNWSLGTTLQPGFTSGTPLAAWDNGSSTDLFGVLSGGAVERYNTSSGSSQPVTDSNLAAGTPLAVWELGSDIYLYGVNNSGQIDEMSFNGSTWSAPSTLAVGSDTFANNSAPGIDQWGANDFTLYGIDTNGQIKDVFDYGGGVANQILGGSPAYSLSSSVSLYTDSSGIQQMFAQTKSGDLAVLNFNLGNGGWGEHPLGRSLDPATLANSIPGAPIAHAGNLAEQDLFQAGADGLVREDRYYYGTQSDSGMSAIDPNTKFLNGSTPGMLTAFSDGVSTNVFGIDQNGKLDWAQYTPGRGWSGFLALDSFVFSTSASFPAGAPISAVAQNGYLYLFGVATDGNVREYVYNSSTNLWTLNNLGSLATFNQGTQLAAWDNGSTIDVFGVGSNGAIDWLQESSGNWTAMAGTTDNNLAAGTPLAVWELSGSIYLYGVNTSGKADEIIHSGSGWSAPSTFNVGSDTFANDSALGIDQWGANDFTLYGVDNNGSLKEVLNFGGGIGNQVLGGSPSYSTTSGTSIYNDPSGIQEVFAPTKSGDLAVLDYNLGSGANAEHPLGRSMSASGLVNSISGTQTAVAGNLASQDVFFVGSSGYVQEDVYSYNNNGWTSGLTAIDSNTSFNAGSNLTAYSDGTTTNVFGVNGSGSLMWAQFTAGRGWSTFLPVDSFVFSTGASFPAGAPISAVVQNGQLDLFGVGTDGYVREYTYTASTNTWTLADLSNLPKFQAGSSLAAWASGSAIDVFGVLSGGAIEWLHQSGGTWTASDAYTDTNLAAGTALSLWESGGKIDLFGVNSSHYADQLEFNGTAWTTTDITAGGNTYAGSVLLGVTQDSAGEFSLYGVNNANEIKNQYYLNGSGWQSQDLGGSPPFSMNANSVGTALYVDPTGVMEVFGQTTSGGLAVVKYNGSWSEQQLA